MIQVLDDMNKYWTDLVNYFFNILPQAEPFEQNKSRDEM